MENIKFILEIWNNTEQTTLRKLNGVVIGNKIYFDLHNGLIASVCCLTDSVYAEITSKIHGPVDNVYIPFRNYFTKKRCSKGAPEWDTFIDHGMWHFSEQYEHVLPTEQDFKTIGAAMNQYMQLFMN